VRERVLSGRGGPGLGATWTGAGINSSAVAQANAAEPESRSISYAENSALPLGPYTTFRGQPVDSTSILIAYTRTGDANLDGLVNDDDVTIVGASYAPAVPQPSWALGDFDFNGFVDDDDVTLLGAFYNPQPPAGQAPPSVAISLREMEHTRRPAFRGRPDTSTASEGRRTHTPDSPLDVAAIQQLVADADTVLLPKRKQNAAKLLIW
jgi:hypothetical protein